MPARFSIPRDHSVSSGKRFWFQYMAAMAIVAAAVGGCSSRTANYPPLGQVSGVVTLDSKPLAGASVLFQPPKGRGSTAHTDRDGRYRLVFTPVATGAIVGPHRVTVEPPLGRDDRPHGRGLSGPVECDAVVKAGSNVIDLRIEGDAISVASTP